MIVIVCIILLSILIGSLAFLAGAIWQNNRIVSASVEAYSESSCLELKTNDVRVVLEPKALKADASLTDKKWIKLTNNKEEK